MFPEDVSTFVSSLGATLGVLILLWLAGTWRRDVSLVDLYWGPGFLLVAAISSLQHRPLTARALLMLLLVGAWALRLAGYLLWRNWNKEEDRRYRAMRTHHGPRFWWISLFTVFLLQGVLQWTIALPLQVIAGSDAGGFPGPLDLAGAGLWLTGFLFESIGDAQLARFQSNPKNRGHVLQTGLWNYTRHPNYFGDCLVWWGLFCLSIPAGGAWTVFSPILMTILLLKVSGVTLLESTITERRPEYADYQRRTSPFVPWPPKARESQLSPAQESRPS